MKNGVDIELGKTNRLKAMRKMEVHTWSEQTMCQQTKTKHENKKNICKKEKSIMQTNSIP